MISLALILYSFRDVNGDGDIDIIDIDVLMRYLSDYLELNVSPAANVLQDGELDIFDVDLILRHAGVI